MTELCMEKKKKPTQQLNKIPSVAGYIHTELLDDFAWMYVKSLSLLLTVVSEEKLISYISTELWNCIRDDELG